MMIVFGCGIAGLVYIIIDYGFDVTAIKALLVALAYVWGLMIAIYLMGHGLVAVPRRLFRRADISGTLRRLQSHAPRINEKLEDAISKYEELEAQVRQLQQRKTGTARDYQEWIEELADMTSTPENRASSLPGITDVTAKTPAVITDRYLADLGRRLAQARHQRARRIEEWDQVLQSAADLQAILDSKASQKLSFGRVSPHSSFLERTTFITPYMRYHLYVHLLPAFRIILGALAMLASICITWSEIIKFPAPQLSIVSLTVVHHPSQTDYKVGFGGQLTAAAWLLYMSTCALVSINDVPVWGNRALVRRNTYSEHACWYAGQIAKLTVPLSYNFLTFLPKTVHQNTVFYHFLGRLINLTPLGTGFDYVFPILVLIPACATLFNLYGRIKGIFGLGILEDEDDEDNPSGFGTGGWREGRTLIDREIQGLWRSSPSPAAMSAAKTKAQGLIDENTVMVFSKSYCPYCKATKSLLSEKGAKFQVLELDQIDDGAAIQDALEEITNQRSVPNIFIKQQHIGGNSDLQARKSQLKDLLLDAGAI
ncbi:putative lmbr1 domain protein [Phaeomoniella chlamydospora]|uniref:Putative lmbr1 domain protein n=1 Tax=Phaeomoniella chlamydospora TaxID=158046 RepID=A0A0G2EEW7_PHACM|nr:putative lmbr1 domain protein [Phaeomoniella chlamydospora]